MALFLELIQAEASLAPVVAEARREYFPGGGVFRGDPRDAPAAEVRFFEWLLFEREHSGSLLVEELLPEWRKMASPEFTESEDTFLGTCVGAFEVGEHAGEDLHWCRDIAGFGEYAVEVRAPEGSVEAGDLIVGRLFPVGDSAHVLSPGAGCFRDENLLTAVRRDMESARDQSSHKALRIRQVDLEAMFWGPAENSELPDPVSSLRAFLEDGGLGSDEIDGLIEALASRPVPRETTGPFFARAITDLLDHLAFETDIDLAGAQEKFLACWAHLHSPDDVKDESGDGRQSGTDLGHLDPEEALLAFDQDRAAGLDAETAIERLGSRLGVALDLDTDPEAVGGGPAGALFPGLMAEYFWDLERVEGEEEVARQAAIQSALSELQDVDVVEEISHRRLLLLGCTRLSEEPDLSPEQRHAAAHGIGKFCAWCAEHHGLKIDPAIVPAFETFADSLVRISGANDALPGNPSGDDWQRVQELDEALVVMGTDGVWRPLELREEAAACLRTGDFVRGEFAGEVFAVQWCYPPELEAAH